ncbi:MAG: archease [Candidatus Nanoarchaeia archaeon]|nr:archease [Candidatus Nanoarchaeia archaeon]
MFEYLEHDADIGIFVKSETLEELFMQSFLALKDYSYDINYNIIDKLDLNEIKSNEELKKSNKEISKKSNEKINDKYFRNLNNIIKKDKFEIKYNSLKYLLHDFLSKILYLNDIKNIVINFCFMKIEKDVAYFEYEYFDYDFYLESNLNFDNIKIINYKNEIKAITNHQLSLIKKNNFYIATIFFDI